MKKVYIKTLSEIDYYNSKKITNETPNVINHDGKLFPIFFGKTRRKVEKKVEDWISERVEEGYEFSAYMITTTKIYRNEINKLLINLKEQ